MAAANGNAMHDLELAKCDEWMYEIAPPEDASIAFKKQFRTAFKCYAAGNCADATQKFCDLLSLAKTTNESRGVLRGHMVHVQHHLERLYEASQSISSTKRPIRSLAP